MSHFDIHSLCLYGANINTQLVLPQESFWDIWKLLRRVNGRHVKFVGWWPAVGISEWYRVIAVRYGTPLTSSKYYANNGIALVPNFSPCLYPFQRIFIRMMYNGIELGCNNTENPGACDVTGSSKDSCISCRVKKCHRLGMGSIGSNLMPLAQA